MSIKIDGNCSSRKYISISPPIVFGINVNCNGIVGGNILSRGYQTWLENYGNFRGCKGEYDQHPLEWKFQGEGGIKLKCPPWVGELHNACSV